MFVIINIFCLCISTPIVLSTFLNLLHSAVVSGELECLDDVNIDQCLECIRNHPDVIVGIKLRLSAQLANGGKHEEEALR